MYSTRAFTLIYTLWLWPQIGHRSTYFDAVSDERDFRSLVKWPRFPSDVADELTKLTDVYTKQLEYNMWIIIINADVPPLCGSGTKLLLDLCEQRRGAECARFRSM
jgi:hypothetical protein